MVPGREQSRRIRVIARYRSTGVFLVDLTNRSKTTMLFHEALRLPAELAAALKQWVQIFGDLPDNPTSLHVRKLNEVGKTLARDLKAHLGRTANVEYQMMTLMGLEGMVEPVM